MDQQNKIFTRHDKPNNRDVFINVFLLWSAIERSETQIARIRLDKTELDSKTLFADIHFFLVTVSNIQKMMLRLRKIFKNNKDYAILYKRHIKKIELLDSFRDHLEHFDERLDGLGKGRKPLLEPNMLGNLMSDEYNFGGEKFNLNDAFKNVEELKNELFEWNQKNCQFPL